MYVNYFKAVIVLFISLEILYVFNLFLILIELILCENVDKSNGPIKKCVDSIAI